MTTEWDALPDTIKTFMTALDAREDDRALGAWVTTAAAEYTYTTEFTGATTTDAGVDVGQHLEGDVPGGVADLHYRFALDGALIRRLVIEP